MSQSPCPSSSARAAAPAVPALISRRLTISGRVFRWGGYHESRRCSRDTFPESYITKYTSIRRSSRYHQPAISRSSLGGLGSRRAPPLPRALPPPLSLRSSVINSQSPNHAHFLSRPHKEASRIRCPCSLLWFRVPTLNRPRTKQSLRSSVVHVSLRPSVLNWPPPSHHAVINQPSTGLPPPLSLFTFKIQGSNSESSAHAAQRHDTSQSEPHTRIPAILTQEGIRDSLLAFHEASESTGYGLVDS